MRPEHDYFAGVASQLGTILDRDLPAPLRDQLRGLEFYLARAVVEAMIADGNIRWPHAGTGFPSEA